jgi:hypothetical protein
VQPVPHLDALVEIEGPTGNGNCARTASASAAKAASGPLSLLAFTALMLFPIAPAARRDFPQLPLNIGGEAGAVAV